MAKARATCTCSVCGKTFEKCTVKTNRREADRWEEWAQQTFTVCPECEQKEHEAKAAELAKQAAEDGMATLTGSQKQVVWAEQIRAGKLALIDAYWAQMLEKYESAKANGKEERVARMEQDMKLFNATRDWILANASSASWWIDSRDAGAERIISKVYRDHKADIDAMAAGIEAQPEPDEKELLTPENPAHGTVNVQIAGQDVQAIYPKDETFRQIVKGLGYKFDGCWHLSCNQFTGDPKDRAAELANILLREGFSVSLDRDLVELATSATYAPRVKKWVRKRNAGKYNGWLDIDMPSMRDDGRERLYKEALKLRGAIYDHGGVVVPVSSHELVEDFARVNGYKLSKGTLEAIAEYEAKRLGVTPAAPAKQEQPDVLADILKSDDTVLPDLVDDDAATH